MKYKVTRTRCDEIVVETEVSPGDALHDALDYNNQHNWSDEKYTYVVEELM